MLNSLLIALESIRTGAMRLTRVQTADDLASFLSTSSCILSPAVFAHWLARPQQYYTTATILSHHTGQPALAGTPNEGLLLRQSFEVFRIIYVNSRIRWRSFKIRPLGSCKQHTDTQTTTTAAFSRVIPIWAESTKEQNFYKPDAIPITRTTVLKQWQKLYIGATKDAHQTDPLCLTLDMTSVTSRFY